MNNTKTKQIIAGLPDESWVTFYNTDRDTHIDAAELKALAAAVPEWVPVSERLPENPNPWPLTVNIQIQIGEGNSFLTDIAKFYKGEWTDGEGRVIEKEFPGAKVVAWLLIPPYQEDKDDIEEKIRKVTERGDAITGDEFEGQRR